MPVGVFNFTYQRMPPFKVVMQNRKMYTLCKQQKFSKLTDIYFNISIQKNIITHIYIILCIVRYFHNLDRSLQKLKIPIIIVCSMFLSD